MPLLRVAAVAAACLLVAGAAPPPPSIYHAVAGHWAGSLEYKDYRDSTRRVTLPTRLDASIDTAHGGIRLDFTYDDGPGKTVYDHDLFTIDAGDSTVHWGSVTDTTRQRFRVTARVDGPDSVRLVLEGEGADDDAPATLHETITVRGDLLVIRKETRPTGGVFAFRHEYRLRRS